MNEPSVFPLHWPLGRPRAKYRAVAAFRSGNGRLLLSDACKRLTAELKRIDARDEIVSSNIRPTLAGLPSSSSPQPTDPGVAVYFTRKGKPYVLACDRWNRVADNIGAIAHEIEANRGRERWGVVTLEQAFEGFAQLPAVAEWWQVLGLSGPTVTREQVRRAFVELARIHHPDQGGDPSRMADLNIAYKTALEKVA